MNSCLIHERSNIIPISPSSPTRKSENEYSLKENFFDPSKSSPPNEFMKKLQQRMSVYNSLSYSSYSSSSSSSLFSASPLSFIKEDNRDIE
jgi:hypothetical protein